MTLERLRAHIRDAETSPNHVDQMWAARHRALLQVLQTERIVKHPGPGGTDTHGTGTSQQAHSGVTITPAPERVWERPKDPEIDWSFFDWKFTVGSENDNAMAADQAEFERRVQEYNDAIGNQSIEIDGTTKTVYEWIAEPDFGPGGLTPPTPAVMAKWINDNVKSGWFSSDDPRLADGTIIEMPPPVKDPRGYLTGKNYYAPGLEPLSMSAPEAYDYVNQLSEHIDSGWDKISEMVHQRVLDQDFTEAQMEKYYDTYFKREYQDFISSPEGSRLRTEINQAQVRAAEAAQLALPELIRRGDTLRSSVRDYVANRESDIGSEFEGAKYGWFKDEERYAINEAHPDLAALWKKSEDARAKAQETAHLRDRLGERWKNLGFETRVTEMDDSVGYRRQIGTHYYALPADMVKEGGRYGDDIRFKDYKMALDPPPHVAMRTYMFEENQTWQERARSEREFFQSFREEVGEGFYVLSGSDYQRLYSNAQDSANQAVKRFYTRAENLAEDWHDAAKSRVHTSNVDLIRDGLEENGIPMGGDLLTTHKARTKGGVTLANGSPYLPTAWIEKSNENGPLTLNFRRNARAHYYHTKNEMMVDGSLHSTLHEFGHRIEHIDPTISAYEEAFYKQRTAGIDSVPLKSLKGHEHYPSDEYTRHDAFHTPYTGKRYSNGRMVATTSGHVASNNAYELISTGYSDMVMFPERSWTPNPDNPSEDALREEENFYFGLIEATARGKKS